MDTYVGFDSAWTDNSEAPGAICAVSIECGRPVEFHPPQLASFAQALTFIRKVRSNNGATLVALDQPTIVPNQTSLRPVERAAGSLVGWLGGGVQPSNRGRQGMFCDASPIWRFLEALGAVEDPEQARTSASGLYLIEVFPALALASLDSAFCTPRGGPRYNPARKNRFRHDDWVRVAQAATREAGALGCEDLARWCGEAGKIEQPRKPDQDKMDAALCVLIALHWRLRPRSASMLLGDLATGYMVLPASPEVRAYLTEAARRCSVGVDGVSLPRLTP
jgi:predicted RNase H-like nuclease